MMSPNLGYFAIRLSLHSNGGSLFLSSDGEGNMKLKPSNSASYPPPIGNWSIDPALLFRLVDT